MLLGRKISFAGHGASAVLPLRWLFIIIWFLVLDSSVWTVNVFITKVRLRSNNVIHWRFISPTRVFALAIYLLHWIERISRHRLVRKLRRLERVFRCCSVCETMEDYKEGYLTVWTNYMSSCNSIVGLYFKGTCDVILVTMATHKVHKSVLWISVSVNYLKN